MIHKILFTGAILLIMLSGCGGSNSRLGTSDGNSSGGAAGLTGPSVTENSNTSADAPDSSIEQAGSVESAVATGTNMQAVGVDEPDRIKSDGEFLYIFENQFENAFEPPQQHWGARVATNGEVVKFAIEPLPSSSVGELAISVADPGNATTKLRILALQNDVPDAAPVTELQLELDGGPADGMYLFNDNAQRSLILTNTSYSEYFDDWDDPISNRKAVSMVTKLDVTNPTQTSLEQAQSVKIEGQILSSRRIDDKLFVASRYYPVPKFNPYDMSLEEYEAAIGEVDLTQMPPKITSSDGSTADLVNPAECTLAVEKPFEVNHLTPDIVSLAVIDLKTLQLKDSECFIGYAETLYATPNSVYLAATRWDLANEPLVETQSDGSDSAGENGGRRLDTDIHQFDINDSELTYSGSGMVSGHLGYIASTSEPYRVSEKGDYLRVATFLETEFDSVNSIRFTVLDVTGDRAFVKVSELPNANYPKQLGTPGQFLYASRFVGDRVYVDTFSSTEPFYVIDISDPTAPKLAGELEIDGYSDFLQPIGENHLLGIGRNAVPGPVEFGESEGVKLSLFNVADANNPIEVQSIVIGERGTETVALKNHRAITIQAATDSHPARVALGIDVHGSADPRPASSNLSQSTPWNYSGLHGFNINVGSGAGIETLAPMMVNSASHSEPLSVDSSVNDRTVIVGDAVYYIRGSDVFAALWSDLGNFNGPR